MLGVIADITSVGQYISPVKVVMMLVLAVPWLYLAPWVQKDAARVRLHQGLWSAIALASGTFGIFLWLVIPNFFVGMLIYLIFAGGAIVGYAVTRDKRVEEKDDKVLTAAHFRSVFQPASQKRVKAEIPLKVRLYNSLGKPVPSPSSDDGRDAARSFALLQDLMHNILWCRASEAELVPSEQEMLVRFVIDGVVDDRPGFERAEGDALIQYIKTLAGMNPEERRRPQEGKVTADLAGKGIDINVTTAGSVSGQRMQFRVVQELVQTHLDTLGLSPDVLARVRELNQKSGLIIVSSQAKQGLTSTLYSLLREHDAFTKQLATVESKARVELENVTQNVYGDLSKLGAALVGALRKDPDVLLLDQCPDTPTAELVNKVAKAKTILLGMTGPDTFNVLARWMKFFNDPAAAAVNLRCVINQVLVRKLCPQCREAYTPDAQKLAKANIAVQKVDKFYQPPTAEPLRDKHGNPVLCPTCQGNGYLGRTAAFEFLEVTDEIRKMLSLSETTTAQIRAVCRKNRMRYLQDEGIQKVIAGVTSMQEVIRVTRTAESKS